MENIIKPEELKSIIDEKNSKANQDIMILDVRRKSDYDSEPNMISGATWQDPEQIDNWSKSIPENKQVVIYCVKGGSVSKSVSEYLNNKQIKTSYLEGGIKAWRDFGGETN
ncbi:MAG: sulfurtransferase [Desulfamplus sp.]|nr:sulfurtransferase [Desulfamplus sp.]